MRGWPVVGGELAGTTCATAVTRYAPGTAAVCRSGDSRAESSTATASHQTQRSSRDRGAEIAEWLGRSRKVQRTTVRSRRFQLNAPGDDKGSRSDKLPRLSDCGCRHRNQPAGGQRVEIARSKRRILDTHYSGLRDRQPPRHEFERCSKCRALLSRDGPRGARVLSTSAPRSRQHAHR